MYIYIFFKTRVIHLWTAFCLLSKNG
eukprot:SAG11_NODE_36698_length_260_cov_0.931677_1_plen_25_part_01